MKEQETSLRRRLRKRNNHQNLTWKFPCIILVNSPAESTLQLLPLIPHLSPALLLLVLAHLLEFSLSSARHRIILGFEQYKCPHGRIQNKCPGRERENNKNKKDDSADSFATRFTLSFFWLTSSSLPSSWSSSSWLPSSR